jgi:hypothetical protein
MTSIGTARAYAATSPLQISGINWSFLLCSGKILSESLVDRYRPAGGAGPV